RKPGCTPYSRYRHGGPPAALSSMVHCGSAKPWRDIGEHHAHAGADPYPLDVTLRREHAIRPHPIADHAKPPFLGRLAALRVQFDQQHEIGRERLERRLNGMMHFSVGMHGAAPLDRHPFRLQPGAPRARGGWRIAQQLARGAALQTEIVLRTVSE